MKPERRVSALIATLLTMAALVSVAGCGVSSSGAPVKIGDALSVGGGFGNDSVRIPDGPSMGLYPDRLVRLFLMAGAGGDNLAVNRLREFLNKNARSQWKDPGATQQPSSLTVIRLTNPPVQGAPVLERTPVTVTYQVVGSLNDLGQVADLGDPAVIHTVTFWVVPEKETSLRIDEIQGDYPPQTLMISDEALTQYYRPQPIYFWDATSAHLVPDLRYLPLTLGPDQRAQKIVQWLLDGPSKWIEGPRFAARLPTGTSLKDGVTKTQRGSWVINLAAPTGIDNDDAIRRLYYQLQWSLRSDSTPAIDLEIEGQLQRVAPANDDYLRYNLSYGLGQVRQQSYDIVDEHVVTAPRDTTNPPNVLLSKDNLNVAFAAVNRANDTIALVRKDATNKHYLQIVQDPSGARVDVKLGRRPDMSRPVWIPGTNLLLVASGGALYLVQPSGDVADITPAGRTGVTSVSVAPDGRRIAWVADHQALAAPLTVDGPSVFIGSPRAILPGQPQLAARAVAWTSEAWLYVVGTAGGRGAMWQTTVDSGVAMSADLKGAEPLDVVALATGSSLSPGQALLFTTQSLYTFGTLLSGENTLKNPFFVS